MNRGFDLVNRGDFDEAIEVGMQIKTMRHTSAFEILALAYAGQGNVAQAIEVLEEGVTKGPSVWRLWQLLGNYRSDLDRFDAAYEAYGSALKCPDVNTSSVNLNIAIVLTREGRLDESSATLDLVVAPELRLRADAQRIGLLDRRREYEEAIRFGESLRQTFDDDSIAEAADARVSFAMIETDLARAYWFGRKDADRALKLAFSATTNVAGFPSALWLIREIEAKYSAAPSAYKLLLKGKWPVDAPDGRKRGFFVNFTVIADNPDEAFDAARRFVRADARDSLQLDTFEKLEPSPGPDNPKGVYSFSNNFIFPIDDGDNDAS